MTRRTRLQEQFPPSPPCSCEVCVAYCARPGWWTVSEATRALECRFCHHERRGDGPKCHRALEKGLEFPRRPRARRAMGGGAELAVAG